MQNLSPFFKSYVYGVANDNSQGKRYQKALFSLQWVRVVYFSFVLLEEAVIENAME